MVEDGGLAFSVRAERTGTSLMPRRYAVEVAATDACGNESAATVIGFVEVDHDRRANLNGGGNLR